MQINSLEFFGFLLCCVPLALLLGRRWPTLTIVVASLVFYGLSDLTHLPFMLAMVGASYFCARGMLATEDEAVRRRYYWAAIAGNVGLLTLSKLMTSPFRAALFGVQPSILHDYGLAIAPIGISYVIFQLISCLTDIQSGKVKERISATDFTAFALFFPQVTAGPLSRYSALMPQLRGPLRCDYTAFAGGVQLILYGLFKKLVIANNIDPVLTPIFKAPVGAMPSQLLIAVILNPIQLYADFSAYTDIARGTAGLLGITLPVNFNRPYVAVSVTEFWRRWHISLSDWLRDYIYTPLAIRYRALGYTAICGSLIATFVICGIWHGFTFPYAVFGLIHGILLSFEALFRKTRTRLSKSMNLRLFRFLGWFYTLSMFAISEIFFKSRTMTQAWDVLSQLATLHVPKASSVAFFGPHMLIVGMAMSFWVVAWLARRLPSTPRTFIEASLLPAGIVILGRISDQPFVYAQF